MDSVIRLASGFDMPSVGLGTYKIKDENVIESCIDHAVKRNNYR